MQQTFTTEATSGLVEFIVPETYNIETFGFITEVYFPDSQDFTIQFERGIDFYHQFYHNEVQTDLYTNKYQLFVYDKPIMSCNIKIKLNITANTGTITLKTRFVRL